MVSHVIMKIRHFYAIDASVMASDKFQLDSRPEARRDDTLPCTSWWCAYRSFILFYQISS